jgi:hypothetical protein
VRRLIRASGFAIVTLAVFLTGCDSCAKKSDAPRATPVVEDARVTTEPPVPAPESLVAEVTLVTPDAFWKKAQAGMGTTAAILPGTFAGLVCALAGLDPSVAREVDASAPAFASIGAGASGGATRHGFVLALKLADVKRTQSLLVDAPAASFTAKDAFGVRVLSSKSAPLMMSVAIARAGWLLVAAADADLEGLAAYTYRTLPTHARPSSSLEVLAGRDALAGALRAELAAKWSDAKEWLLTQDAESRKKHDGREADFGDAPALVACVDAFVQRRLAMIGDLEEARLAMDAGDDEVHAMLTMKPRAPVGIAAERIESMHPGDALPLLEMPLDAAAAWIFRDDAAERSGDAREISDCARRALGKRLTDDDAKKLLDVADQWSKGRGDVITAAVLWGSSRGLVARTGARGPGALADGDASSRALRGVVDLMQRPVLKAPLARYLHVTGVSLGAADVAGVGKATVATFTRDDPRARLRDAGAKGSDALKMPLPPPLGMAWATSAADLRVAIGDGPAELLGAAFRSKGPTFADDASIARAVRSFEANATFAVIAKPFRVEGEKRPGASSSGAPPFSFAWGRRGHDGWARVEIGYALLHELLRRTIGF